MRTIALHSMLFWSAFVLLASISQAGELSKADRTAIENEARRIARIQGKNVAAEQEKAMVALEERWRDTPEAYLWAQRSILVFVHINLSPDAPKLRKDALDRMVAWAQAHPLAGQREREYHAVRILHGFSTKLDDTVGEADQWLPKFEAEWEIGSLFDADFFGSFLHRLRFALRKNDPEAVRDILGRWLAMEPRYAEHANFYPTLSESVVSAIAAKPPVLPPAELMDVIAPLAPRILERGRLSNERAATLLRLFVSLAATADAVDSCAPALDAAEKKYPGAFWISVARALAAAGRGDAAEASRERAVAVVKSLENRHESNWSRSERLRLLREESAAALAEQRVDDTLGAARALFNTAENADDLKKSLDLAAQAMVRKQKDVGAGQAFLGLVQDEKRQPPEWSGARPSAVWREALAASSVWADSPLRPAVWRRRAYLSMLACDGAAALKAAATAYRLPDYSQADQSATLDAAALAFRARGGFATAAQAFVDFQARGPAAPGEASGLPAVRPLDEAPRLLEETWAALAKPVSEKPPAAKFMNAARDYASALTLAGRLDESLGVMRALYAWSVDPKEFEWAAMGVAGALRARDEHLRRANAWLSFQRYGPAGPDQKAGTDDDLANPLVDAPWTLPAAWIARWTELAEKAQARGDTVAMVRFRLLAGDRAGVLKEARELKYSLSFEKQAIQDHVALASTVLKALANHPLLGAEYARFMQYGKKGPDGREDTADDLVDPLEAVYDVAPPSVTE